MSRRLSPAARIYQARTAVLRNNLSNAAVNTFRRMPSWDDPNALAVPMARLSTQAQQTQARLLTSTASLINGSRVDLPNLNDVTGDVIRDGDIVESWRMPMYSLWSALGGGMDQGELEAQGERSVQVQAVTDLSYSQRDTMQAIAADSGNDIVGYWRVPDEGSACDFCVTIADRLYYAEDLMPVHPNCNCSVEPATRESASGGGHGVGVGGFRGDQSAEA